MGIRSSKKYVMKHDVDAPENINARTNEANRVNAGSGGTDVLTLDSQTIKRYSNRRGAIFEDKKDIKKDLEIKLRQNYLDEFI